MSAKLNKKIYRLMEIRVKIGEFLEEIEELMDELCEDEEESYLADSFRLPAQGIRMVLSRYIVRLNERSMSEKMNSDMEKVINVYKKVLNTGCKPNTNLIALRHEVDFEDFVVEIENRI